MHRKSQGRKAWEMTGAIPYAGQGQRIGLLGGSFDPPHAGHVHITQHALKRFGLDRVWWLVSPGNPLKSRGPAPMDKRLALARRMMRHPRVDITGIEADLGTRYTAQTIAALRHRAPHLHFVWLMGADNLASFHRWQDWQEIFRQVPVGVLARPGDRLSSRRSIAAQRYSAFRLPGQASQLLGRSEAPCWCYVNLPLNASSSTQLRAAGLW